MVELSRNELIPEVVLEAAKNNDCLQVPMSLYQNGSLEWGEAIIYAVLLMNDRLNLREEQFRDKLSRTFPPMTIQLDKEQGERLILSLSGWTRVEDGLPPNIDDVLVVIELPDGKREMRTGWYHQSRKLWRSTDDYPVTHWRPLPEMPQ